MMRFEQINGRRYGRFERLGAEPGLVHAFATRPLNVAPRNGAGAAERAANRAMMAADLGLEAVRLAFCQQVHGTALVFVGAEHPGGSLGEPDAQTAARGRGPLSATRSETTARAVGCDGAATATVGLPLMTFSADCPLVLLFDPRRQVLGLVHASWRCTVARLASELVQLMVARCGCQPGDMLAGIGPGAGPCCYEVQDDVYQAAASLADRERLFVQREGRLYFDLWAANRTQLRAAGLPAENIESADICTMCRNDIFYSYRREGPGCGHFGLMAGLRRL